MSSPYIGKPIDGLATPVRRSLDAWLVPVMWPLRSEGQLVHWTGWYPVRELTPCQTVLVVR